MGKGNWFSSVKKALSPEAKEKKEQKSKKKWFGKQKYPDAVAEPISPPREEVKSTNPDNERKNHIYSDAVAEPEVSTPRVAVEALRHARIAHSAGKSKEETSAIKIQTAFRGHMSRRALRALRGLVRLKSLMEGSVVRRQATNSLRCMQTLSRVQSQVRFRRLRMSEENQALQRQLLQKHAIELDKSRIGEVWDDSVQSKEQVEAILLSKHEAAMRRERALAYALSHQHSRKKNASKSTNPTFIDPANPAWGWSWMERWKASRPWDTRGNADKNVHDISSTTSASQTGEIINRAHARSQLNPDKQSPTPSQKPRVSKKPTPASLTSMDDESKSSLSIRRHSIASYMTPTKSARAKARLQSQAGTENDGRLEDGPIGAAGKRLALPQSPARRPRRHSGPPRVNNSSIAAA